MKQEYTKRGSRSRRKQVTGKRGEVLKCEVGQDTTTIQMVLPIAEVLAGMKHSVENLMGEAGLLVVQSLVQDEAEKLTARRYAHDPARQAVRWGGEDGYVVFAGKKLPMERPRVRSLAGHEVPLERYRLFQSDGKMQDAAARNVLCGVAMRDYEKAVEGFGEGYGIQKSSVSRHWKAASAKKLREMMERPLGDLDLLAILLDGIAFQDYLFVVALGMDTEGRKHVLGLWAGATENETVCQGLLDHLIARGLPADRKYLFVLDGSKALKKAVLKTFEVNAVIQRCILHKERNILDHLPKQYHRVVRMKLRVAWGMRDYAEAKAELKKAVAYLEDLSASAAESLLEAFEETLTLHRLAIPDRLRISLSTTNCIESSFSSTRGFCENVRNWKNENMASRWAGTMLLEVEKRFRRIRGYRQMAVLAVALGRQVDVKEAIA
jgi:transposase-like protein